MDSLTDTFERYDNNKEWFWVWFLESAAELCRDEDYKARKLKGVIVNDKKIDTETSKDGSAQAGMEMS